MDFQTLLFAILDRFTPLDANKASLIKQKMSDWISSEILNNANASGIKLFLKNHMNEWYTHLIFAVIYIPLCIWIQNSLAEVSEEEKETFKI